MRKVMMAIVLVGCIGWASAQFPVKLDVGASSTAGQVEAGWSRFLSSDNGVTLYNGVKVTLTSNGTLTYRYRTLTAPDPYTGIINEQLWRDFVYAPADKDITLTIENLTANTTYEVSIGGFDYSSNTNTPRAADWKADGTTILTTSFGIPGVPIATLMPSAERNYMMAGLVTSDATGKIVLQSSRAASSNGSPHAFVNGIIIDVPLWAKNPSPANDEMNVLLDAVLSWSTGPDPNNVTQPNPQIRAHYVYFCADEPNFVGMTPVQILAGSPVQPTASYDPPVVDMDKTYYWRVDEAVDNGSGGFSAPGDPATIVGKVWSFETIKSFASILIDPANTLVAPGVTAELSVQFSSFSPAMVTWYKDGMPLTAGGDITITDTETSSVLAIANVEALDEGAYHCSIVNEAGPQPSSTAYLVLEKLLAQYMFEQNGDDAVGINDASATGMAYAAGVVTAGGQAWAADPNGSTYFTVPLATAFPRAGFGNGLEEFTYSIWAKPALTGPGCILGSFNQTGTTAIQWNIFSDGSVEAYLRQDGNVARMTRSAVGEVIADQWQHVACSYDGQYVRVYVNGVQVSQSLPDNPVGNFTAWEYPMTLMARQNRAVADYPYKGQADDLRIYNYAMSKESIAQLYYEVSGIRPCIYEVSQFDFNDDCEVNMSDFAQFAAHWLESGLFVP